MSNSPSCATPPVPLRPASPSPNVFDDESFDHSLITSPGSKRCPTFKDYVDKIKQLQQENFQLRVRIYLGEQKAGVKTSSSDLAVLYAQFPQLQTGIANENGNNLLSSHSNVQSSPSASSISSAQFESLHHEVDKLRLDKTNLEDKLQKCEENLTSKDGQIVELVQKNEAISKQLEIASSTIQKLKENQRRSGASDEEVEKLACFAFGQGEDVDLINQEWEAKFAEKSNEVQVLMDELEHARRRLESADRKISGLKTDLKKYEAEKPRQDAKILEMSDSLKDMGQRFLQMKHQNDKLQRLLDKTSDREKHAQRAPEKLAAVQGLVVLLQSRVKELTDFVETLLQLESKKVFTLTGLTNENRENLVKSIEQSRKYSDSLDQLFEKDRMPENLYGSLSSCGNRDCQPGTRQGSLLYPNSSVAGNSKSMFSALDRIRLKSDGVQCNLLDTSMMTSLESANAYVNKLQHDITALEKINIQLGQEKSNLLSQVKSLESSVNVLRLSNHADISTSIEHTNSKLKEENRKLMKRLTVTEDALRHLHTQHAKLVGELKTLRSTYQKSSKVSVGSTMMDATRPADSTSPDLGIDSGHDGAVNSDDSNANNFKEENRILRTTNRELALKLKQTRQALDMTLEKLNSTTKEKEQVEKAICRQLHKTHTILRQAKKSVEKFTNSQCQENIMPSS